MKDVFDKLKNASLVRDTSHRRNNSTISKHVVSTLVIIVADAIQRSLILSGCCYLEFSNILFFPRRVYKHTQRSEQSYRTAFLTFHPPRKQLKAYSISEYSESSNHVDKYPLRDARANHGSKP